MAGALRRRRSPPETLPLEGTYTDNLPVPFILGLIVHNRKFVPFSREKGQKNELRTLLRIERTVHLRLSSRCFYDRAYGSSMVEPTALPRSIAAPPRLSSQRHQTARMKEIERFRASIRNNQTRCVDGSRHPPSVPNREGGPLGRKAPHSLTPPHKEGADPYGSTP